MQHTKTLEKLLQKSVFLLIVEIWYPALFQEADALFRELKAVRLKVDYHPRKLNLRYSISIFGR